MAMRPCRGGPEPARPVLRGVAARSCGLLVNFVGAHDCAAPAARDCPMVRAYDNLLTSSREGTLGFRSMLCRKRSMSSVSDPTIGGFAYPIVFVAVVALGIGALAAVELESTALQREREAELLFRGQAIREAIRLYYEKSPGTLKTFPQDLKDLISDPRTPGTRRYLRKLYRDPMTLAGEWVLIRGTGGGIRGVRTASERAPFKRANFPKGLESFAGKEKVSEWVFEYAPALPQPPPVAVPPKQIPQVQPVRP